MIRIHRAEERGGKDHGWLKTKHSFSFDQYYNPRRMNFGMLRVLNEDVIGPGEGFGTHSHDNMEIVTVVLEGALEHKDSSGGSGVIRPGEVQSMSAGTGVSHSEFNHSKTEPVHLLQIWIATKEKNIRPRYEQQKIEIGRDRLVPIAGKRGVYIHQDAILLRGIISRYVAYRPAAKRNGIFVFIISGEVRIGREHLGQGDSAEITHADSIELRPTKESDVLVMEVPMD